MDKHYDLIFNNSLYPMEIIREFGMSGKHWSKESYRKRELSLRHDMVCIYLCNLEEKPYVEMLETLQQQRKRKIQEDSALRDDESSVAKRPRLDEPTPGTSTETFTSGQSHSSSGSSASIPMDHITIEAPFRFILIEGMPTPELIQNNCARIWNIDPPNSMWDIADTHLRKFIEVKVTYNVPLAEQAFEAKRIGLKNHSALCIVNPQSGECTWIDHPGGLNGENKVMTFIITRYEIMRSLNIVDTDLQDTPDLISYVFPDQVFNEMKERWVKDWYPLEIDTHMSDILKESEKRPIGIVARDLLENLTTLDEEERKEIVKWKGKLLPDGWTHNILESAETDVEMINTVFEFIESQNWEYAQLHPKSIEKPNLLRILNSIWEKSNGQNFSLHLTNTVEDDMVKDMLGIGAKRRRHCEEDNETVQPSNKPLKPLKYHRYFDEIIRRLNNHHDLEGKPFLHLIEDLPETDHPIAKIGIQATRLIITDISERNSSLYSSRLTNLYSRLGGAYLITKDTGKTNHSDVSMMPLYATIKTEEPQIKMRAITGIAVRGPQHARSPTDKIQIITLEILLNNPDNRFLLKVQGKHDVWYNESFLIAVRPNSIMKEDSSFITFNSNSLFVPANLLGVMTIENPHVAPNINMLAFVEDFLRDNKDWFAERFTEGIVMSATGNSRDEGYFAQLRKLFMLLLTFRRHKTGANWDIKAYCSKVNECLIDNPLSMHFHNTILKILRFYDNVSKS